MNDISKPKGISEAIGTILSKLCDKVADELGEHFAIKISQWRQNNALSILEITDKIRQTSLLSENEIAHPKLVHHIIEEGSWNDCPEVQQMWGGLLASSCNEGGDDESNIIFINILKQLSSMEATILNYACEKCEKEVTKAGWINSKESLYVDLEPLKVIAGTDDFHRLDRELDHLRSLELIHGGFDLRSTNANITPTPLAIQMFVRCQGYIGSPTEYFGIDENPESVQ